MADRYIRFKLEAPKTLTKKKDLEVYRKLEYLGIANPDGTIKKKFLRRSIKQEWQRYMDSQEYINTRDEEEKNPLKIKEVTILEDMTYDDFIFKYFEKLLI